MDMPDFNMFNTWLTIICIELLFIATILCNIYIFLWYWRKEK